MKILTSERSGVCRLGISLYPEFASQEDNFAYLRRAAEHGFDVLFLALLGAKGTYEEVVERYLAPTPALRTSWASRSSATSTPWCSSAWV